VSDDPGSTADDRPVLRVVRGTPDAAELAALVAVMAAASGAGAQPPLTRTRSAWSAAERTVRGPLPTGGWRASSAPR
jgi:hypothetical protein